MSDKKPLVLVVCDKDPLTASMKALLGTMDCDVNSAPTAIRGSDAARDGSYDVIIINSTLEGRLGDELAVTLTKLTYSSIVILAPEAIADRLEKKVCGRGIFVVPKPLHKDDFLNALHNALIASERAKVLYEENLRLTQKIRDLRVIERAKVLLVEYLKLSEDQSHKYIEQQAMELRISAVEVANRIISTYEI